MNETISINCAEDVLKNAEANTVSVERATMPEPLWHDATEKPMIDDREMIAFMVDDPNSIYHTKLFFVNLITPRHLENWNDEVHFSGIQKWCYYADLLNAEVRK